MALRIATWNVNSLRARLDFVLAWLGETGPDICCLQETKLEDAQFPTDAFWSLGYESAHHGNGRWNGVAIISKLGLSSPRSGFTQSDTPASDECRIISATCGDIRVFSVYVPNGREVASEHYETKLAWLSQLRSELDASCASETNVVVCGDFNVAPEDRDVWDITKFVGATHVTDLEREGFSGVLSFGLVDTVRSIHPDEIGPFSWWDYRAGAFHKGWGMRIDHVLASGPLAEKVSGAYVDREARKKRNDVPDQKPSDHAPVVVDFAVG